MIGLNASFVLTSSHCPFPDRRNSNSGQEAPNMVAQLNEITHQEMVTGDSEEGQSSAYSGIAMTALIKRRERP
jgi:hypothetical protein